MAIDVMHYDNYVSDLADSVIGFRVMGLFCWIDMDLNCDFNQDFCGIIIFH